MAKSSGRSNGRRRPKGEGTVFEEGRKSGKPTGWWVARIPVVDAVTGQKRTVVRKKHTEAEARAALKEAQHEAETQGVDPSRGVTLARYLQHWLKTLRPTVEHPTWARAEERVRLHIVPALGNKAVRDLKPSDVEDLMRSMVQRGAAVRSANHVRTALGQALGEAEREGIVSRNVARLAKPLRVEHSEMQALTEDEVQRLTEATVTHRYGTLWVVLANTGMRLGEALGLTWDDIDLESERPELTIQRAWARVDGGYAVRKPKTAKSKRTIPLRPVAVDALRAQRLAQATESEASPHWATYPEGQPVWTTETGERPQSSSLNFVLTAALKTAGLPGIRIHDLRHTFATNSLRRGVRMDVVSRYLGHSTIRLTVDTYGHLVGSDLDSIL